MHPKSSKSRAQRRAASVSLRCDGCPYIQDDSLKAELQGDTVQVELAAPQPNGRARDALDRLAQIRELRLEDRTLHARVENGAAALPAILGALGTAGVEVAAATIARPSLDDVYLRYTGRSFAEAERKDESDTKEGDNR